MLCENCKKNNATTHIKRIINGVVTEKHLCSQCAAKSGFNSFGQNSLANMLVSIFGESVLNERLSSPKRCSFCNSSFSDIAESGKVGCAECYKVFGDELIPYIKRVHGNVNHIGKIPNNAPLVVKTESKIELLRKKLSELVDSEKFEDAAKVRDEIKELERQENDDE